MATQVLVIFIIRTSRPWWSDRPAPALIWSSVGVVMLAWVLPFLSPVATLFGLAPPPWEVLGVCAALTVGWAMATGVEPFSVLKVLFIAGIVGCAAGLKLLPAGTAGGQRQTPHG